MAAGAMDVCVDGAAVAVERVMSRAQCVLLPVSRPA